MSQPGFMAMLASIMGTRSSGEARGADAQLPGDPLMQVIKVRSESNPAAVAGAIANAIRNMGYDPRGGLEMRVVGERANYMATKAMGIAREYLAPERPQLVLASMVSMEQVQLTGVDHTMIVHRIGWCDVVKEVG